MPNANAAPGRGAGSRDAYVAGEPQVGIEPTTARLRIECSTPELLWRGEIPTRVLPSYLPAMPWRGLEPRRLAAPPPQDGVSTNFTTRANHCRDGSHKTEATRRSLILPSCGLRLRTGATGLEPATSRVTVECSNQTELRPQTPTTCAPAGNGNPILPLHDHQPSVIRLTSRPRKGAESSPNGNRTRLCTLKGCRPSR